MKALILNVLMLTLGSSISQAQFSEEVVDTKDRRFFIGGSVNYNSSENRSSQILINGTVLLTNNNNSSETSTYIINPTVGFQITKNWILGLDLLLTNNKTDFDGGPIQSQESSGTSIGAFVRYIINPENKVQVYASPYFRKTSLETNFIITSPDISSEESNNLGISIGAQYEIADWIRATTNIGGFYYSSGTSFSTNSNSIEEEVDFRSSGFNFRASSIYFGVEFLF